MIRPVTVSEVMTYDQCPQMWYWRYVEGIAGEDSSALRLGTAVHEWFAQKLKGEKPLDLSALDLVEEDKEQAEALQLALNQWERRYADPPWDEVIQVEEAMKLTFAGYTFLGKPDAVVRWNGKLWHTQHKSVGRSVPLSTYTATIRNSLHEGLYCSMLEKLGVVGGTMLNVVRKLSLNTIKKDPGSALHMEFIPITKDMRAGVMQDLVIRAMDLPLETQPSKMYRNRAACHGRYGNSYCPFYGLCWGDEKPDERPHVDPLERYKEGA